MALRELHATSSLVAPPDAFVLVPVRLVAETLQLGDIAYDDAVTASRCLLSRLHISDSAAYTIPALANPTSVLMRRVDDYKVVSHPDLDVLYSF